ncbi:hypothetical protein BD289DRAFT_450839 [Coniella lustricola]|uniref:DUF726 domain protein n=1 Tax=Coniella lustricola TaxID=2025994 RepID=A0A2T3AGX4_9PEZI|nr:hypothetical protein BD289DRAFT_450839 [Coniella lustricola]
MASAENHSRAGSTTSPESPKRVSPMPLPATGVSTETETIEYDDFGLPIRRSAQIQYIEAKEGAEEPDRKNHQVAAKEFNGIQYEEPQSNQLAGATNKSEGGSVVNVQTSESDVTTPPVRGSTLNASQSASEPSKQKELAEPEDGSAETEKAATKTKAPESAPTVKDTDPESTQADQTDPLEKHDDKQNHGPERAHHTRDISHASISETNGFSEFSHQQVTLKHEEEADDDDGGWQTMPAFAPYDMYDDDNRLIAKEYNGDVEDDETYDYGGIGGAGKGYTRVFVDDDAESATSMDDNTQYLFKEAGGTSLMDNEETRDAVSQMQATKDLLTEGQKIAYVGLVRIEQSQMVKDTESFPISKSTKKAIQTGMEATKMWSQKIIIRLYSHMEISADEQIMIEQLSEHGVISSDLTPQLMANARVKNPLAHRKSSTSSSRLSTASPGLPPSGYATPRRDSDETAVETYDRHEGEELPAVRTPSQLPVSDKLDIDIRWTILCDLFLVLIADSIYDSRSRVLLERVGKALEIEWIDICRFEKRVTEALEMQQQAERENWNEDEHKENRRKLALKKRYVMMGLATVGGGLVIGLSAGLLAPVIGAGLAAGFTTIGVTGTSTFLGGAAASAIITSGAAASGSIIGVRAANRRTGAVKTFEYRPLHNNKRVNLIVTVSGWMTGKVDDVRLPFSTVDPVMGDIYSVLWEPEMLTSMGDTINILATEALTQGLQQVLGSTILVSLMAALQLPVVLTKLSYLIDNPWSVSLDRAWAAGLILADSLVERNLGSRPITLVGYSLGARVIFSCLLELARKGAYGLIQNVYMFGSPIVVKKEEYLKIRTVVSGRFVNGYHRNDWILGYLFRLTNGGIGRVAGLAAIEGIPGLENVDTSELVKGHMDYRRAMPRLLRETGWLVESDEFSEIEDPDPEKHEERQRELINEIEEARKQLEKDGGTSTRKSGAFGGFFSRKKKAQKAEWEVYEDSKRAAAAASSDAVSPSKTEDKDGNNYGVLFDVDAMRAELARTEADESLPVRELHSTLPPMRLPSPNPGASTKPRDNLTQTQSDFAAYHSKDTSFGYGYSPTQHGEIQMTFDTAFEEPPRSSRSQTNLATNSYTARPDIKTSHTSPSMATAASNPWADVDDDDDFGKEEEISMTFA